MYEYTVGKRIDALMADLKGSAVTRIHEASQRNNEATYDDVAAAVYQVEKARRTLMRAVLIMERAVDNI